MKDKILKKIFSNLLLKGSFVLLGSSLVANFGSYLFHLYLGRKLGPADYGLLESLISLIYYLGIPMSVFSLIIIKFVSQNSRDKDKISLFFKKVTKVLSVYGLGFLILFLVSFPLIKNLLKTDSFFLFLGVGIYFYLSIFSTINTSSLRGLLQFYKGGTLSIVETYAKLFFSIGAILLGFRVGGVLTAIVFSSLTAIFVSYFFLKKFINFKQKGTVNIRGSFDKIHHYSSAVFLSNLSLTSLYTFDIVMARYFLSPVAAGQYAALSVLGKIIFFASSPVAAAMFPIICEKQSRGEKYKGFFGLSILFVGLISAAVSLVYFIFPQKMILLLYGESYLPAASSLFSFAIFISIYSLCNLFSNYFLSISKLKTAIFSSSAAILQIVLIFFFHQEIRSIIFGNTLAVSILLLAFLVYYWLYDRK